MLFSAGTFLYVSTVHVLPEIVMRSGGHSHHSPSDGADKIGFTRCELLVLVSGALLPLALTAFHHHWTSRACTTNGHFLVFIQTRSFAVTVCFHVTKLGDAWKCNPFFPFPPLIYTVFWRVISMSQFYIRPFPTCGLLINLNIYWEFVAFGLIEDTVGCASAQ